MQWPLLTLMATKSKISAIWAERIKHNKSLIFSFKSQEKLLNSVQSLPLKCRMKFLLLNSFLHVSRPTPLTYFILLSCCCISASLIQKFNRCSCDHQTVALSKISDQFYSLKVSALSQGNYPGYPRYSILTEHYMTQAHKYFQKTETEAQ